MTERHDSRELERMKARYATLLDRFLFSFACQLVAFFTMVLAMHFGYQWIAGLLFLSLLAIFLPLCFYFGSKLLRLRWRYYNLDYRIQIDEERSGERGVPNISLKRTNQSLRD